jgi:hypothetical protein
LAPSSAWQRQVTAGIAAFLAKQSFAPKRVPKRELGNQKMVTEGFRPVLHRRDACATKFQEHFRTGIMVGSACPECLRPMRQIVFAES